EEGRGPLTSNGPEAGGFTRTRPELPAPNVEFFAAPVMFADSGLAIPTAHPLSCGPALLTPRRRGSPPLAPAAPTAKPTVVHNYLADPADLQDAVDALRIGLDIARQKAMAPYTEALFRPPASESDADLRAYALRWVHSIFHPTGSCAMGAV